MESSILYIVCTCLGSVGAWLISHFAFRLGLMDIPNERSSHEIPIPVPKGGGIGILAAFVLASIAIGIPASFWLSASLLALFSFIGDRFDIPPKYRLFMQFVATFILLSPFLFSESSSDPSFLLSDLSLPISALCCLPLSIFIVGTANFYNFMDGINGMGGITGVLAFGLLGFNGFLSGGNPSLVALAVCVSLACLGFLPFNIPKAKVFMGDVGSILLGFVFAGMAVWLAKSLMDFVCMAAILFPFYADELSTMAIRLKDALPWEYVKSSGLSDWGKSERGGVIERISGLARPHRRHLYQLLVNEMEIAHWKVSAGYGIFQAIVGIGVLIVREHGMLVVVAFIATWFAVFLGYGAWVRLRVDDLFMLGSRASMVFSGGTRINDSLWPEDNVEAVKPVTGEYLKRNSTLGQSEICPISDSGKEVEVITNESEEVKSFEG
jgi:Fuc2NAc and GlcNAc transferase